MDDCIALIGGKNAANFKQYLITNHPGYASPDIGDFFPKGIQFILIDWAENILDTVCAFDEIFTKAKPSAFLWWTGELQLKNDKVPTNTMIKDFNELFFHVNSKYKDVGLTPPIHGFIEIVNYPSWGLAPNDDIVTANKNVNKKRKDFNSKIAPLCEFVIKSHIFGRSPLQHFRGSNQNELSKLSDSALHLVAVYMKAQLSDILSWGIYDFPDFMVNLCPDIKPSDPRLENKSTPLKKKLPPITPKDAPSFPPPPIEFDVPVIKLNSPLHTITTQPIDLMSIKFDKSNTPTSSDNLHITVGGNQRQVCQPGSTGGDPRSRPPLSHRPSYGRSRGFTRTRGHPSSHQGHQGHQGQGVQGVQRGFHGHRNRPGGRRPFAPRGHIRGYPRPPTPVHHLVSYIRHLESQVYRRPRRGLRY